MKNRHKYGWRPDVPDGRDYVYSRPMLSRFMLPKKVDLRKFSSPVENQGELGSCTAQALAGCVEILDKKADNKYEDVSRLFLYYNERRMINSINEDSGAYIRDGIKSLAADGICPERSWPYDVDKFAVVPPVACYTMAKRNRISQYIRLMGLGDILSCVADGFPVTLGMAVYESFESDAVARSGLLPMPGRLDSLIGGHAVCCVGYDRVERTLTIRNSWGVEWGDKGHFKMPFAFVDKYCDDMWVIKK